jgi:hypothetical protein
MTNDGYVKTDRSNSRISSSGLPARWPSRRWKILLASVTGFVHLTLDAVFKPVNRKAGIV